MAKVEIVSLNADNKFVITMDLTYEDLQVVQALNPNLQTVKEENEVKFKIDYDAESTSSNLTLKSLRIPANAKDPAKDTIKFEVPVESDSERLTKGFAKLVENYLVRIESNIKTFLGAIA